MQYIVTVDERFTHTLVLEAASKEEAREAAYKLLTDGLTPELEKELEYQFESEGYTGHSDVWED